MSKPPKKKRAGGQISGLAGEFFVAAELLMGGRSLPELAGARIM